MATTQATVRAAAQPNSNPKERERYHNIKVTIEKYSGASDERDLLGFLLEYGSFTATAREKERCCTLPLYILSPRSLLEGAQDAAKRYTNESYEEFKIIVLRVAAHGDPYDYYVQLFEMFSRYRRNDDSALYTLFYTLRNYRDIIGLFTNDRPGRESISQHRFITKYLEKWQMYEPKVHKWMRRKLYDPASVMPWDIVTLESLIKHWTSAKPVHDRANKLNVHFRSVDDKAQFREVYPGQLRVNRKEPDVEEVLQRKRTSKSTRKVYHNTDDGKQRYREENEEDQDESEEDEAPTKPSKHPARKRKASALHLLNSINRQDGTSQSVTDQSVTDDFYPLFKTSTMPTPTRL
jgi:hypothetical protein